MACDSRHLVKSLISTWLLEETSGNISAYELKDPNTVLNVSLGSLGILAGAPYVETVVEHFDCTVEWHLTEGTATTTENQKVATISGAPSDLVRCESLIKILLSRSSSIATYAKRFKDLFSKLSWKGELVSPFMNTPGFALVEENAIFAAGLPSSRKPSSFLLPSCHVIAAGGIDQAIKAIKSRAGSNASITLECNTYEMALDGVKSGANCIRFIDLNAKDLEKYAKLLKATKSSVIIEASADFDESNIKEFALSCVDVLTSPKIFNGCPPINVVLQYEVVKDFEQTQKRKADRTVNEPPPKQNALVNFIRSLADAAAAKKSTDSNGNVNEAKVDGPKETSSKRPKTDSSPTTSAAPQQLSRPKTSQASAKKTSGSFNRPGNRSQSSATPINRNQHNKQAHDSRRVTPSFRPNYQGLISPTPGSIEGARVNPNLQPHQQAANAYMQQAGMTTLMNQQQQHHRHPSLMGQDQQQQHQQPPPPPPPLPWQPMMGGPSPQQPFGGVCHNCGVQFLQGQSFCNNCRVRLF